MLLIIEILLTIKAYKKGWKFWAILPPVTIIVAGMAIGSSPFGTDLSPFAYIFLDLLLITVLGIMTAMAPNTAEATGSEGLPALAVEQPTAAKIVS